MGFNPHALPFFLLGAAMEIWLVVIFAIWTDYSHDFSENKVVGDDDNVSSYYNFFVDVGAMVFLGFGFLMTFLKKYGYSAVGLNFFLSALVVQWALITIGFWEQVDNGFETLEFEMPNMVDALFCAASLMITFGGILGKTTPLQLLFTACIFPMWYSLNYYFVYLKLKAVDIGGSMVIHVFGAYYGIAMALVISKSETKGHALNGARYDADLFAMIGTLVLWLYWPSFNGALAPYGSQFRAIVNTFLSISASTVTTFVFSYLYGGGKFNMVHIQNATLAGGVAVGSSADLVIKPAGAIGCGIAGGLVSVTGFAFLAPLLAKVGLQDTCGIHNLHGMPGIIGAIASIVSAASAYGEDDIYGHKYDDFFKNGNLQPLFQLAALGTSLGTGILGGVFTGIFVRLLMPYPKQPFDDAEFWIMEEEEHHDKYDGKK